MTNLGGRPTEYNYKYLHEKMVDYLTKETGEKWNVKTRPEIQKVKYTESAEDVDFEDDGEGESRTYYKTEIIQQEYVEKEVVIPSIEGFALYCGFNKDTLYEWEKQYKEFSDDMKVLRASQANILINKGITGEYNSIIAKVLLSKHGYREGIEQTGKDGEDLIPRNGSDEAKAKILATVGKQPKKYVK